MRVLRTEHQGKRFLIFIIEDNPPGLILKECASVIDQAEANAIVEQVVGNFARNVWLRMVRPLQLLKLIRQSA